MAVLLVVHEVRDDQKRAKITATLRKRHRISMKITESAFALHTTLLPVRIFDEVKQFLEGDDQLYVIPIVAPYTGYGPRRTTEWLSSYLSH